MLHLCRANQVIEIGSHFIAGYTKGWGSDEPGAILSPDRWRVEIVVDGYNGAGGYWIREIWKWDRCGGTHHEQPRSLSFEGSRELERIFQGGPLDPIDTLPR